VSVVPSRVTLVSCANRTPGRRNPIPATYTKVTTDSVNLRIGGTLYKTPRGR